MTTKELRWMVWYTARSIYGHFRSYPMQVRQWRAFWKSYRDYNQVASTGMAANLPHLYPCIADATAETEIEPTYFYQDAWAFEKIVQLHPPFHVDVGSHHKFVALLSKVLPVTIVDIRPLSLPLNTLKFQKGSIVDLPFKDGELPSVSSLCVVEHIGLGRYGDPLDPLGSEKAIAELKRVVVSGGRLFISVPVGEENIVSFNAGRIFSREYLYQIFKPFDLVEENYIVGNSLQANYEPRPGFGTTGLFELRKP
jgi:SAM-dependent methyltransferase